LYSFSAIIIYPQAERRAAKEVVGKLIVRMKELLTEQDKQHIGWDAQRIIKKIIH
jgi:hypothetical protein